MSTLNVAETSALPEKDSITTAIKNAMDKLLNIIFGLTHRAAGLRSMIVSISFFCIWFILPLTVLTVDEYVARWQTLMAALDPNNPPALITAVIQYFLTVYFHPVVVRHLLAMYVPFWLMHRLAAIYLADIFEKEETVSRTFIMQAAFASSYHTVRIRQGKVADGNLTSPIIQIGGPGKVVVELDSAVLFERPDGTIHIIGPTTHGGEVIEGFERIRQGFDLRDVIDKQDVTTRSRDGIMVTAKDIQYSYSLYRGANPEKSLKLPYPFDPGALEALVYVDPRPVKPDTPPSREHDWETPLPRRIAGQINFEMTNFVNKRGLGEFLATIGSPEEKNLLDREIAIDERSRTISGVEKEAPGKSPLKAGDFTPRTALTKMFYESFQKKAPNRGSILNWIGVGTWETPTQIILDNHREAWKQSRENFLRGNPDELDRLHKEAKLQELLRLIKLITATPIGKFYNDFKLIKDEEVILGLLHEYLEVLQTACEIYRKDNSTPIPQEISRAIQEIYHWFPGFHSVGDTD